VDSPEGGFRDANTDNKKINTDNNIYTTVKSKKNVSNTSNEEKTSKNSLIRCTDLQLWQIGMDLDIHLDDVRNVHEQILELIESGEFQKKRYGTTVYFTLRKWLRMKVERGQINHMNEVDRMDMEGEHPDKKREIRELAERMRKDGRIA
jgi:hypothetical protein